MSSTYYGRGKHKTCTNFWAAKDIKRQTDFIASRRSCRIFANAFLPVLFSYKRQKTTTGSQEVLSILYIMLMSTIIMDKHSKFECQWPVLKLELNLFGIVFKIDERSKNQVS